MADQADETVQKDKDSDEETYRNPLGISSDEEGPEGFVRVAIVFPGLKKKFAMNTPSNGKLDLKLYPRGMNLMLTMTIEKKKLEKFQYKVKQFPDIIVPEKSYYKVKDNQVVVFLKKSNARSWIPQLTTSGLETYVGTREIE